MLSFIPISDASNARSGLRTTNRQPVCTQPSAELVLRRLEACVLRFVSASSYLQVLLSAPTRLPLSMRAPRARRQRRTATLCDPLMVDGSHKRPLESPGRQFAGENTSSNTHTTSRHTSCTPGPYILSHLGYTHIHDPPPKFWQPVTRYPVTPPFWKKDGRMLGG